jgi:hypothetical protein
MGAADNLKLIAAELAEALKEHGHLCLHEEDWGKVKQALTTLEDEVRGLREDVRGLRESLAEMRAERNFVVGIVGFAGAVLGGLSSWLAGR